MDQPLTLFRVHLSACRPIQSGGQAMTPITVDVHAASPRDAQTRALDQQGNADAIILKIKRVRA